MCRVMCRKSAVLSLRWAAIRRRTATKLGLKILRKRGLAKFLDRLWATDGQGMVSDFLTDFVSATNFPIINNNREETTSRAAKCVAKCGSIRGDCSCD